MSTASDIRIPVHVLSQYVRLTKEHIRTLFGEDYVLTEIHRTAWSNEPIFAETVNIKTETAEIHHLRIIGENPKNSTVNLLKSGFRRLYPKEDETSTETENTFGCLIQSTLGTVVLADGVRPIQRHVLLSQAHAAELSLVEGQVISMHLKGTTNRTLHHFPVTPYSGNTSHLFLEPEEASAATISESTRASFGERTTAAKI